MTGAGVLDTDRDYTRRLGQDHRAGVVRSVLLATGGICSAISTIVGVSAADEAHQRTARLAIVVVGLVAVCAFALAAIYLAGRGRDPVRRRRGRPGGGTSASSARRSPW
jgi:hypothetical protein